MFPEPFKIGPLPIRLYGVAMAVSFLIAFWLSAKRAPREQLDPEAVLDSFLPLFLGAIIGARILYVITDFRSYMQNPLEILKIWRGGLVFYGGFLGGMIGTYIFTRVRKLSFWRLMDLYAPYAGLGYAIHRTFGCFLGAGCCYGKLSNFPWPLSVTYPITHITHGIPVYPTQLMEALNGLIIFTVLLIYRRKPHKIGMPSAIFLFIYSTLRFLVEFLRGDPERGFFGPLSTSQWISLFLFALGIVLSLRRTQLSEPYTKEQAEEFLATLYDEKNSVKDKQENKRTD